MNNEPKFELTWMAEESSVQLDPCLKFEVMDAAHGVNLQYEAAMQVCPTPRCPCQTLCVSCVPLLPEGSAIRTSECRFWIDVSKRVIAMTRELEAEPETLSLAEMICAKLSAAAWEELHRWFWTAKIEAIETAEISEIDIAGLPNADDGHMVPFVEVFPLGLSLNFPFENGFWAADEAYCVQTRCKCTQTILSFLQLKDATGKRIRSLEDVPAIRYDYRSEALELLAPGPAGAPPIRQLLAALKALNPLLNARLELHHNIMQTLYLRSKLAETQAQLKGALGSSVPATIKKVGRNDPCPCGSGRKFKKCCGV